ncbi:MAG: hypothetical protein V4592_13260 [Bacteroidota bacterium]
MNLKLVFQLSLFGLIMAFATVSLIPEKIEFFFWLVIFAFCAYLIAKVCTGKYFMHGFVLSLFNSVWVTAGHLLFFTSYMAHHPDMAAMTYKWGAHPRLYTLLLAIPSGIVFGLIMGLFAFVASKMVKPGVAA